MDNTESGTECRLVEDLPVGSVISCRGLLIRHRGPAAMPPGWRGDNGITYLPVEVQWRLCEGASVVRVGNGEDD